MWDLNAGKQLSGGSAHRSEGKVLKLPELQPAPSTPSLRHRLFCARRLFWAVSSHPVLPLPEQRAPTRLLAGFGPARETSAAPSSRAAA